MPARIAAVTAVIAACSLESQLAVAADAPGAFGATGAPLQRPITEIEAIRGMGESYEQLGSTIAWFEILFPDLRLQTPARVADGPSAVVFSWPVHVVSMLSFSSRGSAAGVSLFVEPQIPTDRWSFRGLLGLRAFGVSHGFGAVLESGGVLASDGSGVFVGGGPSIGDLSGILSVVARRYFLLGEARWDFTLDLTLPTRPLLDLLY